MARTQDFSAAMKDFMGAFPVDASAFENAFRSQASLNEKLAGVALGAAEKSADISNRWTRDTIARLAEVTRAKDEPADYARAVADFTAAAAEVAAENMAAFAEVARKVQIDTVELLMSAGKSVAEDATAAVKKAAGEATAASRKAAAK